MKYTPGPWGIDEYGDISNSRGEKIVIDEDMKKADARLIAPAPDYHEWAYNLAMLILQSNLYEKDIEIREAVDNVLHIWRQTEGRI